MAASAYEILSFVRSCKRLLGLDFQVRSHDLVSDFKGDRSWSRRNLLITIENSLQKRPKRLESLKIRLPLAHDSGALEHSIRGAQESLHIMPRLEEIDVAIDDGSGRVSFRYNSSGESDEHRKFTNRQHQAAFWRFVQLATVLKTLSVSCTHTLDFGLLPTMSTRIPSRTISKQSRTAMEQTGRSVKR